MGPPSPSLCSNLWDIERGAREGEREGRRPARAGGSRTGSGNGAAGGLKPEPGLGASEGEHRLNSGRVVAGAENSGAGDAAPD